MVELEKDTKRAEFLKKSSPIANKNVDDITPPPLFSEEERVSILGDTNSLKNESESDRIGKLIFWKNWKDKQYTYASLGLALLLVGYVGVSVSGLWSEDTSLNATLTVPESNQESLVDDVVIEDTDQIIDSEVLDSSVVIEDIKNDSSIEESDDITEYIFENYNF